MAPRQLLLLSDGIPGHYRCAEGILQAFTRLRAGTEHRLEIRRAQMVPAFAAWGFSILGSPASVLRRVYRIDPKAIPQPDLIISAGGNTIAANIALAQLTGAPNIFFGSLRRYQARDFALALNSYATDDPAPNQVRILKPSPGDPAKLATRIFAEGEVPGVCGLLVGGSSGDGSITARDWNGLFKFVDETHRCLGVSWIVSNSRRTPDGISDRLAALAATARSPLRSFIDVRTAGAGTLQTLFAEAGAVAVTSDSSAMLSEAIWMRKPTVALAPQSIAFPPQEQEYRTWLEGESLCRELAIAEATADRFAAALREIHPLKSNPQEDLANLLAARLPELFK